MNFTLIFVASVARLGAITNLWSSVSVCVTLSAIILFNQQVNIVRGLDVRVCLFLEIAFNYLVSQQQHLPFRSIIPLLARLSCFWSSVDM